jgi:ParB-like chromosome segregation protein Spo0J
VTGFQRPITSKRTEDSMSHATAVNVEVIDHEHDHRPLQTIPIDLIDVPDTWRDVKDEKVGALAGSIERQGLAQPIGVWPQEGGRYKLTFGRHRLMACERLGWTTIDARLLRFASDEQRQLMTDAENLFRAHLEPAEELLALKRFKDAYIQANPAAGRDCVEVRREQGRQRDRKEAGGSGDAAPAPADAPANKPKRFDEAVGAQAGVAASTVRGKTRIADRLGEESLELLTALKLTEAELKRLADIEDDQARKFSVNAVLAGMDIDSAIAEGTALALGEDVTVEDVRPDDEAEPEKGEDELSDDEWLLRFCGKVMGTLKFTLAYRRDALLYRAIRETRAKLRNVAKKPLGLSRFHHNGSFARLLIHFLYVDHPSNWLACAQCQGTGYDGNKSKCGACHGDAFITTQEKGKRR